MGVRDELLVSEGNPTCGRYRQRALHSVSR